jgi:hypothetical protein
MWLAHVKWVLNYVGLHVVRRVGCRFANAAIGGKQDERIQPSHTI